jgi:hypothetical protein
MVSYIYCSLENQKEKFWKKINVKERDSFVQPEITALTKQETQEFHKDEEEQANYWS